MRKADPEKYSDTPFRDENTKRTDQNIQGYKKMPQLKAYILTNILFQLWAAKRQLRTNYA